MHDYWILERILVNYLRYMNYCIWFITYQKLLQKKKNDFVRIIQGIFFLSMLLTKSTSTWATSKTKFKIRGFMLQQLYCMCNSNNFKESPLLSKQEQN